MAGWLRISAFGEPPSGTGNGPPGFKRHPARPARAGSWHNDRFRVTPDEACRTMTMLDRMRRHKGWLKWSLAIVVLAFILLYIPSFLQTDSLGANNDAVVASVEGRDITVGRFRRQYQQQMQA